MAGASIAPIPELIHQDRSELRNNLGEIEVDFTRQRVDSSVWNTLKALVVERKVADRRDEMCAGVHINQTEDRAVLHSALRLPRDSQLVVDGVDIVKAVHSVLDRMSVLAERVRKRRLARIHRKKD